MSKHNNSPEIAIHTLPHPAPEKVGNFTGAGEVVKELAERGYGTVFTDRNTFPSGDAKRAVIDHDGAVELRAVTIARESIGAMRIHPVVPIENPAFANVPKLNSNRLKELAGDKYYLYRRVLSEYQPETALIQMGLDDISKAADIIRSVATDEVVLKSNQGFGGKSTSIMDKASAALWVADQIKSGSEKKVLVQPKVEFGRLPEGIKGVTKDLENLVSRARREGLLTELRMFALKHSNKVEMFPVLRVVPDAKLPMSGSNDEYVEVFIPDDLLSALYESTRDIMNKATELSEDNFAIGAVDYYFGVDGFPHVMEANLRSPQLPDVSDLPSGDRAIYKALANTLVGLAEAKKEK